MPPKKRSHIGRHTAAAAAKKAKRSAINASAVAAQRASEDPQQRATRLATNAAVASYDAASTTSDGPETKSKRSAINASAVAAQRASEDPQQRATRLATNAAVASYDAASTASDGPETRSKRSAINASAVAAQRVSEDPQQRATRLATNAAATAASTFSTHSHDSDQQRSTFQRNSRRRGLTSPNRPYWLLRAFKYEPNFNYSMHADKYWGKFFNCQFCNAKKWAGEPPAMCCLNGKVSLPPLRELPDPLKELLTGSTSRSSKFLQLIRKYNCAFQMTSFGANVVRETGWMPTFKVQGQVYHLIGSLQPLQNCKPSFLQIYFITNYNRQLDLRFDVIPQPANTDADNFDRDVLLTLQNMLHDHNSYIRSFKYALETAPSPTFTIVIVADKRPSGEHARRYNAPSCNEVAIVLHGEQHKQRDIVLQSRDSGLQRINETHRSYDALQYPFFFRMEKTGTISAFLTTNQTSPRLRHLKLFHVWLFTHTAS
ncbi:uncharacterized protein LOC115231357 [Octopus sinensis]|uniref:Uncharacterized protein LOC115231357 n=1 Tax=Octopus sinensis TaxID=2607531 RepID=A0A6P7U8E5_9MOLL|nr:uncharacterized protein LOC115231357 [Octopus sinensis]